MRCVVCDGQGCDACLFTGRFRIEGCPWSHDTPDGRQAIEAADQAEHGSWPLIGGWLDQTEKCLQAVKLVQSERAQWKAYQESED